jgi:23S rRNA pseudouridine955/2504/2580 synthase
VKHIIEAVKQSGGPPEKEGPQVSFLTIDEGSEGQRLDNFLIRVLKGVPKTHIYRLVRSGQVRVNKHRASADTRLAEGDLVRIPPVRTAEKAADTDVNAEPANGANLTKPRDFEILFEDDHVLAIAKPAGVAVHGGSGVSFGVIEQLRKARPEARFLELVHRLDRDTSGVLLLAKRRSALTRLQDQFRDRETGKTYLALVVGHWPANKKVLDQPLHKYLLANGERRVKVVAKDDPDGMPSLTLIKHITKGGPQVPLAPALAGLPANQRQFSLVEIALKTGRTHQIRVHLAHQGHRIVGDDKYGDFELNKTLEKLGVRRMFLHARTLSFLHPSTQEAMQIECPLDEELQAILGLLLAMKVPGQAGVVPSAT